MWRSSDAGTADGADSGAAGSGAGFPVTIEHQFGTTEITAELERVVTVGFTDQDPVWCRSASGTGTAISPTWASDLLGGAEPVVLSSAEIDLEAIAALDPDLVVGTDSGMTEEVYRTLRSRYPTIVQTGDRVEYGMPWQEHTTVIGLALGREDRAAELVDEVDEQFAAVRAEHPELEGCTALGAYLNSNRGASAYSSEDV